MCAVWCVKLTSVNEEGAAKATSQEVTAVRDADGGRCRDSEAQPPVPPGSVDVVVASQPTRSGSAPELSPQLIEPANQGKGSAPVSKNNESWLTRVGLGADGRARAGHRIAILARGPNRDRLGVGATVLRIGLLLQN